MLLILRIQTLDLIQRYITKVSDLFEVQIFVYLHCVSTCRNISFHRADIVIAVVSHHIVGSDKGRHIATCFFRQIIVDFPIISFAIGTAECLIDCTGATVISSNYQVPVSIDIIHFFEVTCGSPSRFNRVTAFIYQAV